MQQVADVVTEKRDRPVPGDRAREAEKAWRTQLIRSKLLADAQVQEALAHYDSVRESVVNATNRGDREAIANCLGETDRAITQVANAINADMNGINAALVPHVTSRWERWRGARPPAAATFTDDRHLGSPAPEINDAGEAGTP
jgi:hypothetical protein